ncbi:MAG: 2Fe-2S iron-sulfur cluster-binding protein [Crocinitomicaceae bacterium]|nr:2Fe-2S iron-sulfur cluster-binding protein [Crocinitomicaceae bacterium]MDG1657692.1 2Fe-2S iron-sulfur cluster-binding protein [Crocinitomicaceae bacterium]MDG2440791.1 2Fe-2S iron-sulfur cluster-binding protein [Crocinitomicaceae bacterium]
MFKKLFGKGDKVKAPKGFHSIEILSIDKLTADTVKVELDIPASLKPLFSYTPGQYLNFAIVIDGDEERRSYSICSGPNQPLAVAVKQVENGKVSTWLNTMAEVGNPLYIATPEGNFTRPKEAKNIVGIAAGSGITPLMAIAKATENSERSMQLFYGSKTEDGIIFKSDLDGLTKTKTNYFLSQETKDGFGKGRINKDAFSEIIKGDLSLLKSDGFFVCGPEGLIADVLAVLETFGVDASKIHYELFTAPVLLKGIEDSQKTDYSGASAVTVILDDEEINFELASDGPSLLDKVNKEGYDAPYSCKGGVCATCKARVIEGKVNMSINYSLTDSDVEEGYILTCQAHPASEKLKVTYDD